MQGYLGEPYLRPTDEITPLNPLSLIFLSPSLSSANLTTSIEPFHRGKMDPLSIATSVVSVFLPIYPTYNTDLIVGRANGNVSLDLQKAS